MKRRRFHYYSHHKRLFLSLTGIFTVSLLLLLFAMISQYRIYESTRNQNEEWYGSWQGMVVNVSEQSLKTLENHELLTDVGITSLCGDIQENNQSIGWIGYGDSSFFEMAHLHLLKGEFPESKDEIVLESQILDRMQKSYECGQSILVTVQTENGSIQKEYVLSGIIENYSSVWMVQRNFPNGFILHDPSLIGTSTNAYFIAQEGYESVLNEISLKGDQTVIENTAIHLQYDPFSIENLSYTIIGLLSILVSILFVSYALYQWTKRRSKEIQVLKSLGADHKILLKDIFKLYRNCLLIPICILGVFCLITDVFLWMKICAIALFLCSIFVSMGVSFVQVVQIPDNINTYSEPSLVQTRIRIKKREHLTPLKIAVRHMRWNRKRVIIKMILSSALLTCGLVTLTSYNESRFMSQYYAGYYDYMIQGNMDAQGNIQTIDPSVVDKLKNMPGIVYFESEYLTSWQDTITWENQKDAVFNQNEIIYPLFQMNAQGSMSVMPNMLYISSSDYQDRILSMMDEGDFDEEAFERGQEVILYLPDFCYRAPKNEMDSSQLFPIARDAQEEVRNACTAVYTETSIEVGDTLMIQSRTGDERTVKVQGIIREPLNDSTQYDYKFSILLFAFTSPYTIIGSDALFDLKDSVSHIGIWMDPTMNKVPIEDSLSTICSQENLLFTNNSAEKRMQVEKYQKTTLVYTLISVILTMGLILFLYYFARQENQENRQRNQILDELGIQKRSIHSIMNHEIRLQLICIFFLSLILYGMLLFMMHFQGEPSVVSWMDASFSGFSKFTYLIFILLFFGLYSLFSRINRR